MTETASHVRTPPTGTLFARWRRDGDVRARNRLIELYLPLARRLARRYSSSFESPDDLLQVASLGLVKAVDRFDPDRGLAFSTFAVPTIVGELKRHFRDAGWALHVERGAKERARRLVAAQAELSTRYGATPTVGELAGYLEWDEETTLDALNAANALGTVSLDAPGTQDDEPARIELLSADLNPTEHIDETLSLLAEARRLPRREREILFLRFGRDLPQSEIARRVGISQMHVSRLLRSALARLRASAGDDLTL